MQSGLILDKRLSDAQVRSGNAMERMGGVVREQEGSLGG